MKKNEPFCGGMGRGCVGLALLFGLCANGADPTSFTDNFEGPSLDTFWTVYQQNGTVVFPYTNRVHSGAQAVLLQGTGGGQKELSLRHYFETPQYGKVSVWVYDTFEYIYFNLLVRNTDVEPCHWGVGVMDWDRSTYYYGLADCSGGKSSVPRSIGWHKFTIESTLQAVILSVDDQVIYSGPGGHPFNLVRLSLSGPGGGSIAYDDFSFEAAQVPAPIWIISLTCNGELTWTNPVSLTNGVFTIEWAPAIGAPWRSSWDELRSFTVAGLTNTVEVPMLYRVKCVSNLFVPFVSGLRLAYSATNALGTNWTEQFAVLGFSKPTAGAGKEYATVELVGNRGMQTMFLRSTDSAVYKLDPTTLTDTLEWQIGPMGTTWTNFNYAGRYTRKVSIEAIEDVTVPAGTFPNCYKFHKTVLNAPPDETAEWYEWVCPGFGMVKWVDYWTDNPPATYLLETWTH